MKITVMDRAKKKKFIAGLTDLGMKKIPQMLVKSGQERVRAFTGDMNKDELYDFWRLLPIEGVGLYVGKDMLNRNGVHEMRLSLDGMHIWKDQLTERVLELTPEQEEVWFKGVNIELTEDQIGKIPDGFVNVKSGGDLVGMGKIGDSGKTLFGFLPKEQRRKSQTL